MSPNLWPLPTPFDPEAGVVPAALETLWSRSEDPVPALVLAIGEGARRDGWAVHTAIALAMAWADRGGPVALADLALDSPALHIELGEANSDGVADIFQFGASVRRMARTVPGRGLQFLPAGAYIADTGEILRSPGWEHVLAQFVEDRATLLAYLPADLEGAEELVRRIGRVIVLADAEESRAVAERFARLGAIELLLTPPPSPSPAAGVGLADDPAASPPEVSPEISPASVSLELTVNQEAPRPSTPVSARPLFEEHSLTEPPLMPRARRRSRRKVSPLLLILLVLTGAVGGWMILAERDALPDWAVLPEWATLPGWLGLPERFSRGATAGPEVVPSPEPGPESEAPPQIAEPVESPIPYSVAVEAHPDYATAVDRVTQLKRAEPRVTFFMAPMPSQGMVYYRILAGPVADTTAAWSLMQHLVAARHKTDLDPWSIRPTVWAFHLGDFENGAAASTRAEELLEHQIPTYQVEVDYTAGPPRVRLFAGAYEGPGPAEFMADQLKAAGIDAQLVRRQGKPIQ